MTKLTTAFGPTLISACKAQICFDSKGAGDGSDAGGKVVKQVTVDDIVAAIVASVERSVRHLLRALHGDMTAVPTFSGLKFIRLYWRAFQRLFALLANSLECELENCVLAIVNVTATFLYAERHNSVPLKSKLELREMLDQALELAEKLTGGSINDQIKNSVRSLLWYPTSDMVRAVKQRQSIENANVDIEDTIRWGHLLLLSAFAGLCAGQTILSTALTELLFDDSIRAAEISQLFVRYRDCVLNDTVSQSTEATKLFTDLMLQYLLSFEDTVELQLVLIKQTLYPDWMQRTLCWNIWRELLCFCWDKTLAAQTLQLLFGFTQCGEDNAEKSFVLTSGVEEEVFQLVAFVYSDLPQSLKDMCLDQVSTTFDMITSEGPGHQFNSHVASQLHLLEKLVAVQFLKKYDGLRKEEWIAKYLPVCFECCGTVLELLSAKDKAFAKIHKSLFGMMRVLDMCLLVLKAVFDDIEVKQDEIVELSVIVARLSTEALSQIAKYSKLMQSFLIGIQVKRKHSGRSVELEKADANCLGRALESSLYLLSKLGSVIKTNRNNQCAQVIKDLLMIVDDTQNLPQATFDRILISTARFMDSTLFDMQIADGDMPVVWQLLLSLFQRLFVTQRTVDCQTAQLMLLHSVCFVAVYKLLAHSNIVELTSVPLSALIPENLRHSFVQYVRMRKLTAAGVDEALKKALQSLKNNQSLCYCVFESRFPDEMAESYAVRVESSQGDAVMSIKQSDDNQLEGSPEERRELTRFVTLCREIESSISSMNDETAAQFLTSNEFKDATTALDKLFAKTNTHFS